jgi:hypothetical protein
MVGLLPTGKEMMEEICKTRDANGDVTSVAYRDEKGKLIIFGDAAAAKLELRKHGYATTAPTDSPRETDRSVNCSGKSRDVEITTESPTTHREESV